MDLLIVGLGSMGKRRARLALGLGHRAVGVDSAPARRAEAGALGVVTFETLKEALAAQPYAAALVCTAPLSHADICEQLLDAGLSVFSELNLVCDGYERLIAKAAGQGLTLFLSSTMLYRGEIQYIINSRQEFQKPVNYIYHIGQYLPNWHPWEHYKDFFVGQARSSGIREIFGIELPWLCTAFGPAQADYVTARTLSALELPYPDSWYVCLRHADGTRGLLAADVVSPKPVRSFEVYGAGLHLFWEGAPDSLARWDAAGGKKTPVDTTLNAVHDPRYSDNIVENAYLDELLNFFEVLNGEAQPRWSFEKDLAVCRLMDDIQQKGGAHG